MGQSFTATYLYFLLVTISLVPVDKVNCSCLVAKLCPTLCNHKDCSLPGSSIHGILQARILEWVAMPFSSPTQGSNQSLLHWQVDSLPLNHLGSPGQGDMIDNLQWIYLAHASLMEGQGENGVGVEMMEKSLWKWAHVGVKFGSTNCLYMTLEIYQHFNSLSLSSLATKMVRTILISQGCFHLARHSVQIHDRW